MMVTNGDIVRTMDNKNLAEFLYVLLEKVEKPYDKKAIRFIKDWLDEDYYESKRGDSIE